MIGESVVRFPLFGGPEGLGRRNLPTNLSQVGSHARRRAIGIKSMITAAGTGTWCPASRCPWRQPRELLSQRRSGFGPDPPPSRPRRAVSRRSGPPSAVLPDDQCDRRVRLESFGRDVDILGVEQTAGKLTVEIVKRRIQLEAESREINRSDGAVGLFVDEQ
jgi:hypothetical protein